MTQPSLDERAAAAGASLRERLARSEGAPPGDGGAVAESLLAGLKLLSDAFFTRVHQDVERQFGVDSIIDPMSMVRTEVLVKNEIDLFAIAESAAAAEDGAYINAPHGWFANWLAELWLGERCADPVLAQRLATYSNQPASARRAAFSTAVERMLPEAARAPLVMYRLFPKAIIIATATAFGDRLQAEMTRRRQVALLMSINDCSKCRGSLLANGDSCGECGNPFWKYRWLTAD